MLYEVDPLQDRRWNELLSRHSAASVFHSPEWLQALRRTYRYKPSVLTTCTQGRELTQGVVFCGVNSWLTGRRLVSVPFSDHCEPLVSGVEDFHELLAEIKKEAERGRYKYVEFRPVNLAVGGTTQMEKSGSFCFHKLDLSPTTTELFRQFHKNCVQRKIQRAEREGLLYEFGTSAALIRKFYGLQVITRRRHQLPPQPFGWFQNLLACFGARATVHVVSKQETPLASMFTLRFRGTLVYKYGGSDKRFSNLGAVPWLFWRVIQQAKQNGIAELDLGRSDPENEGLIDFKDRLGAARSTLTYWRYRPVPASRALPAWTLAIGKRALSHLPQAWLSAAGTLFYRHAG